jgi:tripartite-type tricarboxylate transporter receptor subunit TctC
LLALLRDGVGAPRGTPADVIDLLNREINAAFEEPPIKQRFAELGAVPITGSAGRFGEMIAAETER